jgi:2-polyprenyl-3-methyl-5-hydroxy-6-metoxy-1,4-benzoquinol methylase
LPLFRTRYSKDYFESFLFRQASGSQRNQKRLAEILPYHHRGRLLEVGCGMGKFLELAGRHFDVEGMDVSDYAVRHLSQELGLPARRDNIEQAMLPSNNYHVIAIYNVLEHLHNPGVALAKIFAALLPGGITAGSFPNNYGLIGGASTVVSNIFDRTHISTFAPDRWRQLFA